MYKISTPRTQYGMREPEKVVELLEKLSRRRIKATVRKDGQEGVVGAVWKNDGRWAWSFEKPD